jgi:hypothetical protein
MPHFASEWEEQWAGATGASDSVFLPESSPRAPETLLPGVCATMERSPTPPLPATNSHDSSPRGEPGRSSVGA